ncbi:hypothetical protein C4D60_Mb11t14850 [Musa balbisiana]|uniref:Uncharacterized protein n=1 Tax=Musa balbisiana TaxID=52838 RepID=A0A4S8J456_MUSBA|nr:hypothetical protein C4D60_Mb11t14850 [Musa balbisiana]
MERLRCQRSGVPTQWSDDNPVLCAIPIWSSDIHSQSYSCFQVSDPFSSTVIAIHLDNHITTLRPANRVRLRYILYCINNNVRETSGNKSCSDSEYKKLAGLDAASQGFDFGHENEWRTSEQARHLYFEFFESCSPYGRIPLLDKVHELAQTYPGLTSFKSTELSPASWMSVAWYA